MFVASSLNMGAEFGLEPEAGSGLAGESDPATRAPSAEEVRGDCILRAMLTITLDVRPVFVGIDLTRTTSI